MQVCESLCNNTFDFSIPIFLPGYRKKRELWIKGPQIFTTNKFILFSCLRHLSKMKRNESEL